MKTIADAAAKAEILSRLRKLTADTPRQWGKMTAHQMVCHLNDSHRLALGEYPFGDKSNLASRSIVRLIALRIPFQWPKEVPTVPELDQAAGRGSRPIEFEADRAVLFHLIDRFTASKRDFSFARHPMFGEMSEWEWMRWAYLHADHHLRQFGLT